MHFCIALLQQARNIPGLPRQTRQGIDSLTQILTAWKGNAALFSATVQALDALPQALSGGAESEAKGQSAKGM